MSVLACGLIYAASPPQELRFCLLGDPKTFDALHVSDQRSEVIRYLTGGVLVRINRVTDQLQPELAESWKLSDGGRAITFHLRAGLKFSDGAPLTASDVALNVQYGSRSEAGFARWGHVQIVRQHGGASRFTG